MGLEQVIGLVQDNAVLIAATVIVLVAAQLLWLRSAKSSGKPFLDPDNFLTLPLTEKRNISHNTVFLRFSLPNKQQRLGLPVGQHITFLAKDGEGKDIYRPYTPVSSDDQLGSVDFVIKVCDDPGLCGFLPPCPAPPFPHSSPPLDPPPL